MDPDANLSEQRAIAARLLDDQTMRSERSSERKIADAVRLAELVESLDHWIRGGGFLPAAWRK